MTPDEIREDWKNLDAQIDRLNDEVIGDAPARRHTKAYFELKYQIEIAAQLAQLNENLNCLVAGFVTAAANKGVAAEFSFVSPHKFIRTNPASVSCVCGMFENDPCHQSLQSVPECNE